MIKLGERYTFSSIVRKLFKMTPQPKYATIQEWQYWEETSKKENPFIYWFLGDFLYKLEHIAMSPYNLFDSFRVYVRNRFFDKTHTLQTRLKKGRYWEIDTKILHGCFEALVDFVEIENTTMMLWTNNEEAKKYWRYKSRIFRFKSIRSRELGLKYLRTTSGTDPEYVVCQKRDQEIIDLYLWWKDERPKRVDPYMLKDTPITSIIELDTQQEEEDTEKLKQLIGLRGGLWT